MLSVAGFLQQSLPWLLSWITVATVSRYVYTLLHIYLVILSIDHACPVPQELWSTYPCTNGNKETEFDHQYSRYPHCQQPPNVLQTVLIVGFPRLDDSDDSLQDVSPSHPASSSATPLPPTLPLQTLVGGQHPSVTH